MVCPTENTPGLWGPQSEAGLAHGGRVATYLLTSPCAAWDLWPQKGPAFAIPRDQWCHRGQHGYRLGALHLLSRFSGA